MLFERQVDDYAADQGEGCTHGNEGLGDVLYCVVLRWADKLRPDDALELFVGAAVVMFHAGKEIEVGIAGDLGVGGQKRRELGIIAADVFLIGEQGGVVGDDCGEGGAEAEHAEEFVLGGAEVFVADGGGGSGWPDWL